MRISYAWGLRNHYDFPFILKGLSATIVRLDKECFLFKCECAIMINLRMLQTHKGQLQHLHKSINKCITVFFTNITSVAQYQALRFKSCLCFVRSLGAPLVT